MPFKENMLPVENFEACHDHWIPLKEVRLSLLERKTNTKGVDAASLLFFEPAVALLKLPHSTRKFLSNPLNCRAVLTESDLHNIYQSFGSELEVLVSHFHFPVLGTESSPSESSSAGGIIDSKHEGSQRMGDSEGSISIRTATSADSTSTPTDRVTEITCEEFLDNMNSLSIFNFKGFLNDVDSEVSTMS